MERRDEREERCQKFTELRGCNNLGELNWLGHSVELHLRRHSNSQTYNELFPRYVICTNVLLAHRTFIVPYREYISSFLYASRNGVMFLFCLIFVYRSFKFYLLISVITFSHIINI